MNLRARVLIPAYNECAQIGGLVRRVKSMGFYPLVVDDGSKDGTSEEAGKNGAEIIRHEENMGKGISLKTGFARILKKDCDAVIIMDGDAQHSPDDIPKFIDAANKYQNTIIIGNRMNNAKNMPFSRKLTNNFMSFLVSLFCGQKVPDSQCGFRLIKRDLLEKITIKSSRFEIESDILIQAGRAGVKIVSIPIKTLYGKEASQINPFWDTLRFIVFLIKTSFTK
ncbi:MAG: glycosyltransferase family 2 protein [Candidatus Omnitrophota bacterium]|nr:glycosyltransferase family 2 protein [Candidatus Omnitrophota bacterium]